MVTERAHDTSAVAFAATLGREVRRARRELGLDQATTALLAGVSERFLRELEHGKETVQLRQLLTVLDVLGLELRLVARDA
jgi:HTH-type transcriptional regulator / antitoxin HipB